MVSHQIEEYLEAIGRLEERGERVTTTSVARERDVAPPSVTEMLGRMADRGLISYKPRGDIALTEEGRVAARSVMRRHRLWERFLHDVLGLRWDRVHGEACRLEHATSPEVERQLAIAIGDNLTCPHGQPIPDDRGQIRPKHAVPLLELPPLRPARVVSVREEDVTLLRSLEKAGIKPGTLLEVASAEPQNGSVVLRIGNAHRSLPKSIAAGVRVEPVAPAQAAQPVPLAQLAPGETGEINCLAAGKNFVARCLALGFTPSTPVTMVHNPKTGPLIVRVRETRVALGRGEAQKIHVVRKAVAHGSDDASL